MSILQCVVSALPSKTKCSQNLKMVWSKHFFGLFFFYIYNIQELSYAWEQQLTLTIIESSSSLTSSNANSLKYSSLKMKRTNVKGFFLNVSLFWYPVLLHSKLLFHNQCRIIWIDKQNSYLLQWISGWRCGCRWCSIQLGGCIENYKRK